MERAPMLERSIMGELLRERCRERIGLPGDSLALGMRLHCCTRLSIKAEADFVNLLTMQRPDGGWEGGYVYRYASGLQITNRGLTTAIAARAIREYISTF